MSSHSPKPGQIAHPSQMQLPPKLHVATFGNGFGQLPASLRSTESRPVFSSSFFARSETGTHDEHKPAAFCRLPKTHGTVLSELSRRHIRKLCLKFPAVQATASLHVAHVSYEVNHCSFSYFSRPLSLHVLAGALRAHRAFVSFRRLLLTSKLHSLECFFFMECSRQHMKQQETSVLGESPLQFPRVRGPLGRTSLAVAVALLNFPAALAFRFRRGSLFLLFWISLSPLRLHKERDKSPLKTSYSQKGYRPGSQATFPKCHRNSWPFGLQLPKQSRNFR